ncbi:MAG: LPS export ABC transporter permease LptF [Deltaproteobacteria bacterium]|nr:LPS export ABC transporter permease LptF [Deltaproteobacteria bacterium]
MRTGLRTAAVIGFPPLLDRYVAREVTSHAFGGFAVVLGIFLVTRGSALLSDAAVGGLPGGVLALLLGLRTVMALPSLLPAVAYLGVLLAMNRLSRDRELIALAATGVGPGRLERAVLGCALCAALAVGVLAFSGRPWAAARYAEIRDRAIAASGLDDLTPGVFYELRSAAREVVFAGARSATDPGYLEDVFVQRRDANGLAVFSAARAIETRDTGRGVRTLILEEGYQYDLSVEGGKQTVTQFERLAMQVPLPPPEGDAEKSLTWRELVAAGDPESVAEIQWRIAMPIATVLLCLLAIPLGRFDPRSGRAVRIVAAALAYVAYRTLLGTAKGWIANGLVPAAGGLWVVHGACLAVVLALAWRQRRAAA